MAGQAECRAVNGARCCTFGLSQSGHCHNLASSSFWCWQSNIASLLCIPDITLFWRCQTGLVLILLSHCHLVDRIEENNKMVIVGLRLVSSQTRLLPTMTLHSTIICVYCRVQFKKSREVLAKVNTTFHGIVVLTRADWSTSPYWQAVNSLSHFENGWGRLTIRGFFESVQKSKNITSDIYRTFLD